METKKHPPADLGEKTGLFFNLGLVLSLMIVLTAFEWKFYSDGFLLDLGQLNDDFEQIMDVPPTDYIPPPPPKIVQPEIIEATPDDEEEDKIEIDWTLDIDDEESLVIPVLIEKPQEEDADVIVSFVEEQAEPENGIQSFYEYVARELSKRYPKQAQRMGIDGTVYIQFVIERDGSLSDVQAIRGIGGGCDEIAVDVVQNSPKWKPGKQRGQAVRSRRVIPIKFVLN
jgi:periplasmic protein TonB